MKPKQLANVLLKVLGISLIAYAIPNALNLAMYCLQYLVQRMHDGNQGYHENITLFYLITPACQIVVGIFLIAKSRLLAERFFRDDE